MTQFLKLMIGVASLAMAPWDRAPAQTFGAPVVLATGLQFVLVSSAMDSAGDAIVAWDGETTGGQSAAQASYRPAGGQWAAPVFIPIGYWWPPSVHFAPNGSATLVVGDNMVVDLAPGGAWGAPYQIGQGGGPPAFVTNAKGDDAVVFGASTSDILAARRPAGGNWGAVETVASVPVGYIRLDGAALGPAGDLVVSWEAYVLICNRPCHPDDYTVYASRERRPGAGWVTSTALAGPFSAPDFSLPLVDKAHQAAVLYGASGATLSVVQGKQGGWSAPSTVLAQSGLVMGAEVSRAGRASLGLLQPDGATQVDVIGGSIAMNHWGKPVDVSKADGNVLGTLPYGAQTFGSNSAGGVALAWADAGGAVRVASRLKQGSGWRALQTASGGNCSGGSNCDAATSVSINEVGQEVVTWSAQSPDGSYSLYAAVSK